EAEQIEVAGLLHQPPRERPVVRVQLFDDGQDLFLDKLCGGLAEETLLLGQVLASEDVLRSEAGDEKSSAGGPGGGVRARRHEPCSVAVDRPTVRSLSICPCPRAPSASCSICPAGSPSSPAGPADWGRRWPRGWPRRAPR